MRPSAISSSQMEFLSILCNLIRAVFHKMTFFFLFLKITIFKGTEIFFSVIEICLFISAFSLLDKMHII